MVGRTNAGGSGGVKGMPQFTYTGTYSLIDDGDKNWRIKFLTSGTLRFSKLGTGNGMIDVFCVGAGNAGAMRRNVYDNVWLASGGGGGGYTTTAQLSVATDTDISVTVGQPNGGASGFGNISASGGGAASGDYGGNGGSGGGSGTTNFAEGGGSGGADGSNGSGPRPGAGQGSTTREFASSTGTLYSGGGAGREGSGGAGGGGNRNNAGAANTGGGGGTAMYDGGSASSGGSGIVVIRNRR